MRKSVTLNDRKRRYGRYITLFQWILVKLRKSICDAIYATVHCIFPVREQCCHKDIVQACYLICLQVSFYITCKSSLKYITANVTLSDVSYLPPQLFHLWCLTFSRLSIRQSLRSWSAHVVRQQTMCLRCRSTISRWLMWLVLLNVVSSFHWSVVTFFIRTCCPTADGMSALSFHNFTLIDVMESFTLMFLRDHGIPLVVVPDVFSDTCSYKL